MMGGLAEAQHELLIRQIYDGVTADDLAAMVSDWAVVFRSIASHTMIIDSDGLVIEHSHFGPADAQQEYETHWRGEDPRMAIALAHPGQVLSDGRYIDAATFEHSDLYHAVLRPFGIRYSMFGVSKLARGNQLAQAMMRGRDEGDYEETEVRTVALRLWPHLCRALDLRIELGALRTQVADVVNALNAMPSPVLVVDARAQIQHFNTAARHLIEARDGLLVRQQRLIASHPTATAQLHSALAHAIAFADARSRAPTSTKPLSVVVEIPRASRRPLGLIVHPLRPPNVMRTRGCEKARAVVVIHDPEVRSRIDPELIARVHALTPTEAALAASLAEGRSIAEFAAKRGCTEATARTHLKRVLDKTGTCRQGELVHRLLASAALFVVEH